MEKKNPVGKNILVLILTFSIVLIGELRISNKQIFAEGQEVTITTDKAEYVQGDTVIITVKNGLDGSIWGFTSCGGTPFWDLQRFTDGAWKDHGICLPLNNNSQKECTMVLCEQQEPRELKPKSEIKDEWHITFFCEFINENGILLENPQERMIEKGIYRLILSYVLEKDSVAKKTVYSNEVVIK